MMKEKKKLLWVILLALSVVEYLVICLIGISTKMYLFEWVFRHAFLFTFVIPVVFFILRRPRAGVIVSSGSFLGVFIGQFLGDALRSGQIAAITEDMNAEQIANHHLHHGVVIWLICVAVSLVVAVVLEVISHHRTASMTAKPSVR